MDKDTRTVKVDETTGQVTATIGCVAEILSYLEKHTAQLDDAVTDNAVRDGQIWANNSQLEHIVGAVMQVPASKFSKTVLLTKREEEVTRLVAAGLSNREVSEELGLSPHTVKNYLSHVFKQLGISNRTELVLYVLSQTKPPQAENNQISTAYKATA